MKRNRQSSSWLPPRTGHNSVLEQTIEPLAVSFVGKIVEMPVQTQEKTRQGTNPHVVNTVEAEMPKIIKETVQRKWPVINEKINQATKHPEVPQSKVMDKTVEGQQLQIVGKFVETGQSTQTFERLGTAPVCRSTQSEIVEAVEIEVPLPAEYASLMSVTTPVLETPPVVAEYVQLAPAAVPQGTTQEVLVPVAVPKKLDSPQVQLIDTVVSIPVMAQSKVPSAPRVLQFQTGQSTLLRKWSMWRPHLRPSGRLEHLMSLTLHSVRGRVQVLSKLRA